MAALVTAELLLDGLTRRFYRGGVEAGRGSLGRYTDRPENAALDLVHE
jgi:hypothetical protein